MANGMAGFFLCELHAEGSEHFMKYWSAPHLQQIPIQNIWSPCGLPMEQYLLMSDHLGILLSLGVMSILLS